MTIARRYQVVHRTDYEYAGSVTASFGQAHLVPRELPGQRRISHTIVTDPVAAESREHIDYFGNTATYFAIQLAHRHLTVLATSTVDVDRSAPPIGDLDAVGWEEARAETSLDVDAREFTIASPLVALSSGLTDYTAPTFVRGGGLGTAFAQLSKRIHADFEYLPGVTSVRTTLGELLERRRGVCQDFAHLAVGALRSAGLAARYVSGYLETHPPAGQPRLIGNDASHAWAEAKVPGFGWVGIDPTNDRFVDASYIITAWGRDYADVAPLSGVIVTSSARSTMRVSVDVSRADTSGPARR